MRRMYSLGQLEEVANARVKALVEGGTLENAKPIYYHGVELYNNVTGDLVECHILSNSPTQFTRTSLQQWLEGITGEVRVMASGHVKVGNKYKPLIMLFKATNNALRLYYTNEDTGNAYSSVTSLTDAFTQITDAVNKIN